MLSSNRPPARAAARRLYGGAATAVAASAVVFAVAAPSSPAFAAPTAGGVYTLASGSSGKCIEVHGSSKANGAGLVQAACTSGATRQQWRAETVNGRLRLVNVNSGLCFDLPNGQAHRGLQYRQWTCNTATAQQWTFPASKAASGKYQMVSAASGRCVTNKDGSTAGGNPIVQQVCADIASMQWRITQITAPPSTPSGRNWSNAADGFATGTTGGAGGKTVTVTTYADLIKYATAAEPYVIRINAAINVPNLGHEIPVKSNKTLVGVARKGKILRGGIYLGPGTRNVIIRNLTIGETRVASDDPDDKDFDYDAIQMDTADHIWIDHNLLTHANDGLIDSRKDTTNLTVSWNVLADHNKAFGIGWTDNLKARITIHHNWIRDTNQRNPSVDNVAYAHLYNNYLQNVKSYGNLARGKTRMVLENSYFEKVANPYYPATSAAQLVQRGNIRVNCTGKATTNGSAFNPASFYPYVLDPASQVPSVVRTYAGPQSNIGV